VRRVNGASFTGKIISSPTNHFCPRRVTALYRWSDWEVACETVYVTTYPGDIPQGTRVPLWAYYDVTGLRGGIYTDDNAKSIGRDPEATPTGLQTRSTGSAGPGVTGIVGGTSPSPGSSKTAAIVGGVVGGVCALIITPIIVYFVIRRRRRNREKNPPLSHQRQRTPVIHWGNRPNSLAYDPSVSTGPTVGSNVPLQTYNPADPTTFPPPLSWGQTNQFPHQSPVTYVTPFSNHGARRSPTRS